MLTPELLNALRAYTEKMQVPVTLALQVGTHEKRDELVAFLRAFASASDNIQFEERNLGSRVLAVLHAGGVPVKLDASIARLISKLEGPLDFMVFVSLGCHNCPDVVQALNQFAILNPRISTEMIDGGLYPDLVEQRNIQGVPAVFLNGESFANGKIDPAQIIDKLLERYPDMGAVVEDTQPSLPLQDVTVIGSGPAGVSAAIYAARKGLSVTVIGDRFGGQLKDTMGIENLISVPKTSGPELSNALQAHLSEYSVTLKEHQRVTKIDKGDPKTIHLSSGEKITSKTVIVATGAKWRELGVPGERENIGNGVAYCPHCDGPFFKGKDVAVVGGGNSGVEAALDLAGIVNSVTILEFMPELKADQILVDQTKRRDNIRVLTNVATQQITADRGKVTGLSYQDRDTGQMHSLSVSGVFIQIGLIPNSEFLDGVVELTDYREIVINERCETSEPGILACGDVTTVPYKQIIVAMGEGSKAALSAFDYLLLGAPDTVQAEAA